jgi:hypothetical protein
MTKFVKMFGPPGTDECSHGTQRFGRHDVGSFWVSPEAVEPLCHTGGFTISQDQTPTVSVSASRIAELEDEELRLRALQPQPSPSALTIPN